MPEPSRRKQILKAAEHLFHRYGPAKTTIADVAREADVAVGSVYLEFASKDALIEELSVNRFNDVLTAMMAAAVDKSPFPERLRLMFDGRAKAFFALLDEGAHACDLFHCAKSEAVKSAREYFVKEEWFIVLDLLRAAKKDGEIDVPDPDTAAKALLNAYMAFTPPWIFSIPREELEGRLGAMHELVLYGLTRRPSSG